MLKLLRTDSKNPDFVKLVELLDTNLADRDGEDHAFYNQFNGIANLKHILVLYKNKKPVACGALKKFDDNSMEVKRMFVPPEERGNGYATKVLSNLELWAKEFGKTHCILETGKRQPEAIALYTKNGYKRIANYGQYQGIENSLCFQKSVS